MFFPVLGICLVFEHIDAHMLWRHEAENLCKVRCYLSLDSARKTGDEVDGDVFYRTFCDSLERPKDILIGIGTTYHLERFTIQCLNPKAQPIDSKLGKGDEVILRYIFWIGL